MNKFKVGDVVWIVGEKYKVLTVFKCALTKSMRLVIDSINDKSRLELYMDDTDLKPIQREYAILGDA